MSRPCYPLTGWTGAFDRGQAQLAEAARMVLIARAGRLTPCGPVTAVMSVDAMLTLGANSGTISHDGC
jgi:hypothetical protein